MNTLVVLCLLVAVALHSFLLNNDLREGNENAVRLRAVVICALIILAVVRVAP